MDVHFLERGWTIAEGCLLFHALQGFRLLNIAEDARLVNKWDLRCGTAIHHRSEKGQVALQRQPEVSSINIKSPEI